MAGRSKAQGPARRADSRRSRAGLVVLLASQFHPSISQALVDGARAALVRHRVPASRIRTVWVPGAFELPLAALRIARRLRPDAVIALGCLIKGETPQYAAIGHAVADGLTRVALTADVPVTFGVIIADSMEQAKARARTGGRLGNRGTEAALAALTMMDLTRTS